MFKQFQKSLATFLLIRETEKKLVFRLFAFEFFKGAAIAVFFTTAISLFLKQLSTSELPKVYVLSAVLLWVAGYFYHKLEHHFSVSRIILVVLLFNAACMAVFLLMMHLKADPFFLYLFLAFFNVFYLLNNLEFWGTVALLFDVRQSKRLFSIVSAGDIPAKMVGYLAAALLVPFIGTENLLWVALISLGISLVMYGPLIRLPEMQKLDHHSHQHTTSSIQSLQNALTGDRLIRNLALVSFFSISSFIVVNYIFYGYVKIEFKTDKALAGFFGVFLIAIRGVTLLVKLIVTNRVVDKIGLRWSLLITPVVLFIMCAVSVVYLTEFSRRGAFYLFGTMAIVYEVLRSAFLTPVALAALQPLPTHQRLRGHTIIKGFMDPFGFLIMGAVLWLLNFTEGNVDFQVLGFILLGLMACWIWFSVSVEKKYINSLMAVLQKRTISERDISITDTQSLDFLKEKLKDSDEVMALSILQIVTSQPVEKRDFLVTAMDHPSAVVKLAALNQVGAADRDLILPHLLQQVQKENPAEVVSALLKKIGVLDPQADLSSFFYHHDPLIAKTVVEIYLNSSDPSLRQQAEDKLRDWFASKHPGDLVNALQVVSEEQNGLFASSIKHLMRHDNKEVSRNALQAAGKNGHRSLISHLLNEFVKNAEDGLMYLNALELSGEKCLPVIREYLWEHRCEGQKSQRLIMLVGRLPGQQPFQLLESSLLEFPEKAAVILPAMIRAEIKTKGNDAPYKKAILEKLRSASEIVYTMDFLQRAGYKSEVLFRALELELVTLRNNCLDLFSFIYDIEKIKKVKEGFELSKQGSVANSLEMIHVTVAKEFAGIFNIAFDPIPVRDKAVLLRKLVNEQVPDVESISRKILGDEGYHYHHWTKSCILYFIMKTDIIPDREIVEPLTRSAQPVLKEMAEFVLKQKIK